MIEELLKLLGLTADQITKLTKWNKENVLQRTSGFTVSAEELEASEIKDENFIVELKRLKAGQEAAPLVKLSKRERVVRADGKSDLSLEFKIQALK
jgi:U3 small nucleolar ribonucleoprotein component